MDKVTSLGSGVDGAVRRIDTAYDTQGMVLTLTSYADTGASTVVNMIARGYNDFRQLKWDYQEHNGAVVPVPGSTPLVEYAYANGADNHVRLTGMKYPNHPSNREIAYDYGTADGTNDHLSRLDAIKESGSSLATFKYLGLGAVVQMDYPEPGVRYDLWGDVLGYYAGFDRFLRVVDLRWYPVIGVGHQLNT